MAALYPGYYRPQGTPFIPPAPPTTRPLTYDDYVRRLQDVCTYKGLPLDLIGTVWADYQRRSYPVYRVTIRRPGVTQSSVAFVSGLNGDETCGPLAVLDFLENSYHPEAALGAPCPVYPLMNPYGWEHNRRVNDAGDDVSHSFGVGLTATRTPESALLISELAAQAQVRLVHIIKETHKAGFFACVSSEIYRPLAERMVKLAKLAMAPTLANGETHLGAQIVDGVAIFDSDRCPPGDRDRNTLATFALDHGVQFVSSKTPVTGDYWVRSRTNSEMMLTVWSMA